MAHTRFAEIAAARSAEGATAATVERECRDAVPLRRFVEPEEVAGVVAFLCSRQGAAISGQAVSVCGGTTAFAG
jgi:NAD(P)-dependent dehydrogenase (short-subunit alcohol dehydrogenase family)